MKESQINRQRPIVAHHQPAEITEPRERPFHRPSPPVAPQRPAVLRRGLAAILAMRSNQLDAAPSQLPPQQVTIIATVLMKITTFHKCRHGLHFFRASKLVEFL